MKTFNKIVAIMLIALLAISTLSMFTQSAKAADRFFTAEISPNTMYAGISATYTITITNVEGNGIGTANITVPSGFTDVTTPILTTPPGITWVTWFQSFDKISLKPIHPDQTLGNGQTLAVTFNAIAPDSPGNYSWTVYCTTNTGLGGQEFAIQGIQPFLTVTPTLNLNPTSGYVGTPVTITGHNFAPSSTITFTYDSSPLETTTSNPSGIIPEGVTFFVPPSTAGNHSVTATDASHNSISANFTVIPYIQLDNLNADPENTPVVVSGNGFANNSHLTATFDGLPLSLGGITETDSSGSFSGVTFTVPASTVGLKIVNITDSNSNYASAPFTVGKATPSITTSLSTSSAIAGNPVTISAMLHSSTSNVGGTVTYKLYNATSDAEVSSHPVLVSSGVIPNSEFTLSMSAQKHATQQQKKNAVASAMELFTA